jgi:hypothetical protein
MVKYSETLPRDGGGQKTTAVPRREARDSVWVTPVTDSDVKATLESLKQEIVLLKQDLNDISTGASTVSTKETRKAKEPFSGSETKTHTFTEAMTGFVVVNDGSEELTFAINGELYTVRGGEVFEEYFEPFTEVLITTTVPYRAYGRK